MSARRGWILVLAFGLAPGLALAQAPLGRLFFTPEERAELDRAPTERIAADAPTTRTLDGIVRRSDGSATVWINGQPERRRLEGASTVSVDTPSGEARRLKVGESTAENTDTAPVIRIERSR